MGRVATDRSMMIAFPGFGFRAIGAHWHLHFSGQAVLNPASYSFRQKMMLKMLGGLMKASKEELNTDLFHQRITPFMAEADGRQSIRIELGEFHFRLRKRTRRNGHFQEFVTLSGDEFSELIKVDEFGSQYVQYRAKLENRDEIEATSRIYLLENSGTSIVSDIDDTIKETCVGDRRKLLTNTFLKEFRSVDGMADVYRELSQNGASFHYVSSSPWQLFESLVEMKISHQFPSGTVHLRNFRLRDQFFNKVILRRPGKALAIRFLLEHLPQRTFILIGDSGEKDPEIYGKICRKYPRRIKALLIRDIFNRPLETDRWKKVQKSLPAGIVGKFRDAEELRDLLSAMNWSGTAQR